MPLHVLDIVLCKGYDRLVKPAPVGPYGESKIAAEDYIKEHFILPTTSPFGYYSFEKEENERYSDKRLYILRPCMIHGPGNLSLIHI